MSVKRRKPKARQSDAAELEAWSVMFECGHDFFDDLGHGSDADKREAARDAWHRLGRAFLETWESTEERPWAEEVYGAPEEAMTADAEAGLARIAERERLRFEQDLARIKEMQARLADPKHVKKLLKRGDPQ